MMWAALLTGACLGVGLALVWSAAMASRPTLAQRVRQGSVRDSTGRRNPLILAVERRWLGVVEALGSTSSSVERRLELLGTAQTLTSFRIEQLVVAIATMATLGVASVSLLRTWSFGSVLMSVVALVCGALMGASAWDQFLSIRARRRQQLIEQQVPDTSDLLALAVGAGESIPAALARMTRIAHGELSVELARTVSELNMGTPISVAVAELAHRNDSRALDRLCQTLLTALDRGSPLAVVLHEQAKDIREATRQRLMEEGGKREVLMLFPVVFLILPITVIFALFPGLFALRITP